MAAVNPFFTPSRSRPISGFVDESLPANMILQAGLAKQAEQDKYIAIRDKLGLYDQQSLKGGDTGLVDETKADINKFVDDTFNTDFTNPQNQRQIYNKVRDLAQNKKLKQVASNFKAVQDLKAKEAEFGNKAFNPAMQLSRRNINAYIKSGKAGEDIGYLGAEEALDLHAAESKRFDDLKASGGEDFTNTMPGLEGIYFKTGYKGVGSSTIGKVVRAAVPGYAESPEGRQALAIYREKVYSGNIPTDMAGNKLNSAEEYLGDRLLRTGMEFKHGTSTKDFDKGLNDLNTAASAQSNNVVVDASINVPQDEVADLYNKSIDPSLTPQQQNFAKMQLEGAEKQYNATPEGKDLSEKRTQALANLKTTNEKYKGKDAVIYENIVHKFKGAMESGADINDIVTLTTIQKDGIKLPGMEADDPISWEELGLDEGEAAMMRSDETQVGSAFATVKRSKSSPKAKLIGELRRKVRGMARTAHNDNESTWELNEDYLEGLAEYSEGTPVTIDTQEVRSIAEQDRKAAENLFTSSNIPVLFQDLEGKEGQLERLQSYANLPNSKISVGVMTRTKTPMLRVTVTGDDGPETFTVAPSKVGMQNGTIEAIIKGALGNEQGNALLQGTKYSDVPVLDDPTSVSTGFASYPELADISPNIKYMNSGRNGGINITDKRGNVITVGDRYYSKNMQDAGNATMDLARLLMQQFDYGQEKAVRAASNSLQKPNALLSAEKEDIRQLKSLPYTLKSKASAAQLALILDKLK